MADQEWYTIQELADMFGVSYGKVRGAVSALALTGAITARDKPEDRRIVQVHKDSISKVRQASTGQS
jgi:DNA-binding FadR family transcriptional regulator